MNRIDARFAELRTADRAGLIVFVTAGDPAIELMPTVLDALVASGVDLIELGMPFSDPMADGPIIQQSSERALARGVGTAQVLEIASAFRRRHPAVPLVLMGYLNPIEIFGRERFVTSAAAAGVDGLLLVDSPMEESAELERLLHAEGMHQIHLLAPTTDPLRESRLAAQARGFLYYVSLAGVTGAGHLQLDPVRARVAALRTRTETPVAVGFGVKDAATAAAIAAFADAVVIGSALVAALAECPDEASVRAQVEAFVAPVREALDRARRPSAVTAV